MAQKSSATRLAAGHDHSRCVDDALTRAEAICAEHGARLTVNRRRVLALVWHSHAPVGAYELLERLRDDGVRAAPPMVYRALWFLMHHRLVHRIESRNAFIGCGQPEHSHTAQYLLCDRCGDAVEIEITGLARKIESRAAQLGFAIDAQVIEARGVCGRCQEPRSAGRS